MPVLLESHAAHLVEQHLVAVVRELARQRQPLADGLQLGVGEEDSAGAAAEHQSGQLDAVLGLERDGVLAQVGGHARVQLGLGLRYGWCGTGQHEPDNDHGPQK